jgi:Asp-tRNA(Asn)/Glu-tRNA(Gln) amidotransferase A subunit family amidase
VSVVLLPAVEQLRMLRQRRISPLELADEHIRQIERLNPTLNALVDFDAERVRDQARRCMPGQGRLAGLPMTIKSSIATEGYRCEIGSVLHRGHVPTQDAEVVRRLRRHGATILGTTNCPEFLMAYETDNLLYGRTPNPWNLDYCAGGSSGGEAAAIAAGLSAGGLGSDSGGSVREPAAFTGICALKPTPGRIPGDGHLPPCVGPFSSLGAIGTMARTIEDVTLLFCALSGTDEVDPVSPPVALQTVLPEDAKQIPIGWFEDGGMTPVTAETRQAVREAAAALERQGFTIRQLRPVRLLELLEEARRLWHIFFVQCGALMYEPTIRGREAQLSPTFRGFLELAAAETRLSAAALLQAWAQCDVVRRNILQEMQTTSLLLCPVCAIPGFRFGERLWNVEGQPVRYLDAMRYTQWFNLLAAPAAVVPVALSAAGLPIGVQIAGRPFHDEEVLAVAAAVDREFGYRAPPLCRN